ncbi:MAG: DUF885 family protein, partial [Brevundimonas sp.]
MHRLAFAGLAAALLCSTAPAALAQSATEAAQPAAHAELAALLTDYEAYLKARDPISAGQEGDIAAKGRLPDISREAELARQPVLEAFRVRALAIATDSLSSDDRLNRDFLILDLDRSIEAIRHDSGRLAFDSEGGPGQSASYIASVTRITTAADAQAWLSRLAAFPAYYDAALANARRGLETGFTQPTSVVESFLISLRNEVAFTQETDPLLKPTETRPSSISESDWERIQVAAWAIVNGEIAPRRQQWLRF